MRFSLHHYGRNTSILEDHKARRCGDWTCNKWIYTAPLEQHKTENYGQQLQDLDHELPRNRIGTLSPHKDAAIPCVPYILFSSELALCACPSTVTNVYPLLPLLLLTGVHQSIFHETSGSRHCSLTVAVPNSVGHISRISLEFCTKLAENY